MSGLFEPGEFTFVCAIRSRCGCQINSLSEPRGDPPVWYRVNVDTLKQPERKPRANTAGTLVGTRFQSDLLAAIDLWRKAQSDLPTRPEAVRRLVELGMREEEAGLGDSMPPTLNTPETGA